jgi:hypothetical protein
MTIEFKFRIGEKVEVLPGLFGTISALMATSEDKYIAIKEDPRQWFRQDFAKIKE